LAFKGLFSSVASLLRWPQSWSFSQGCSSYWHNSALNCISTRAPTSNNSNNINNEHRTVDYFYAILIPVTFVIVSVTTEIAVRIEITITVTVTIGIVTVRIRIGISVAIQMAVIGGRPTTTGIICIKVVITIIKIQGFKITVSITVRI
jgi:hypothetical protein